MDLSELDYSYPELLVAQAPSYPPRVALYDRGVVKEMNFGEIAQLFRPGDCLVINETKVLRRRVFSLAGDEVLFLTAQGESKDCWQVLFPARRYKEGQVIALPGSIEATLLQKGQPQVLKISEPLDEAYFEKYGELPLPPYIQKQRSQRHNMADDSQWYQTAWARQAGSLAAPTASLHFDASFPAQLEERGVSVARITLHVGTGTFLPIRSQKLEEHKMHKEQVEISLEAWEKVGRCLAAQGRVWALGTTAVRALESCAAHRLPKHGSGFRGETDLFIYPGYRFQVVGGLLTNFHQPQSSLLALVAGLVGLGEVKRVYTWAVDQRFRLFSYGDLSIWIPNR